MGRSGAAPLALGTLAVAAGAAFLTIVGAMPGMATRNILAYALGLLLGWLAHKAAHLRYGAAALFAAGTAILALVLSLIHI